MKKFEEMTYSEQQEVTALFANWLRPYTTEVIVKVLKRRDEIIGNDFTMMMLKELKERGEREKEDFASTLSWMLKDFETFKTHDPHNHCVTHAKSYRDVLYDMYIR